MLLGDPLLSIVFFAWLHFLILLSINGAAPSVRQARLGSFALYCYSPINIVYNQEVVYQLTLNPSALRLPLDQGIWDATEEPIQTKLFHNQLHQVNVVRVDKTLETFVGAPTWQQPTETAHFRTPARRKQFNRNGPFQDLAQPRNWTRSQQPQVTPTNQSAAYYDQSQDSLLRPITADTSTRWSEYKETALDRQLGIYLRWPRVDPVARRESHERWGRQASRGHR
jgi:hypothetical protein